MNKSEVSKLFTIIAALYPRETAFADAKIETVRAWHSMLQDIPYELAQAGVQAHAHISQWLPSIAEIKQAALKLQNTALSADEAWGMVLQAIKKFGYYRPGKAKESLPEEVWVTVERMGYEELCMSENVSVIRGQFMRMWDLQLTRQREDRLIPQALRDVASHIGRLDMPSFKGLTE